MERELSKPVNPGDGMVLDTEDPRFPKVVGRTRPEAVSDLIPPFEIAQTVDPAGKLKIDPVVLASVSSMDGRE